jgi:hypothetical protein
MRLNSFCSRRNSKFLCDDYYGVDFMYLDNPTLLSYISDLLVFYYVYLKSFIYNCVYAASMQSSSEAAQTQHRRRSFPLHMVCVALAFLAP